MFKFFIVCLLLQLALAKNDKKQQSALNGLSGQSIIVKAKTIINSNLNGKRDVNFKNLETKMQDNLNSLKDTSKN